MMHTSPPSVREDRYITLHAKAIAIMKNFPLFDPSLLALHILYTLATSPGVAGLHEEYSMPYEHLQKMNTWLSSTLVTQVQNSHVLIATIATNLSRSLVQACPVLSKETACIQSSAPLIETCKLATLDLAGHRV